MIIITRVAFVIVIIIINKKWTTLARILVVKLIIYDPF